MKRFLLIPSFAFLALTSLTSCQKEEKTALELTRELTEELQKVTDYRTAEAAAPRVAVLQQRMQNAGVRPFALNETALTRSMTDSEGSEGTEYAEALINLAAEVGRIQASMPVGDDGEVSRERLILAVGAANGAGDSGPAAERQRTGMAYIRETSTTHETPGNFAEFYGSSALREALAYRAEASSVPFTKMDSDEDVPAIPEPAEVPEEEEVPVADESAEDSADDNSSEPAVDDVPADTTPAADESDSSSDLDVDLGGDDSDSGSDDGGLDLDMDSGDDSGSDDGGLDMDMDGGDDSGSSDGGMDLDFDL
ncbi:MAG: hypothetical protein IKJ58_02465 [Akkermansia sp.]|nr:hypothetical protein [Akkermansia sp.]